MKIIASLSCLLLTTFTLSSLPALAEETVASTCVAESQRMSDPVARVAYLQSCAAELAKPDRVARVKQQRKEKLCDRNAKGMKLVDERKTHYLERCYHENEAMQQFDGWQRKLATTRAPAGG